MWQKHAKRAKSRQEKEVLETVVPTPLPLYILLYNVRAKRSTLTLPLA